MDAFGVRRNTASYLELRARAASHRRYTQAMSDVMVWQIACAVLVALLGAVLFAGFGRRADPGIGARLDGLGSQHERTERSLRDQLATARQEQGDALRDVRQEVAASVRGVRDSLQVGLAELGRSQQAQLDVFAGRLEALAQAQDRRLEELRGAVTQQLLALRQEHTAQLDAVRETVDVRLQQTLEERLGASFRLVSERLEQVHRGLGEMQALAAGVGDLKRVLANVKVRGMWGEVQLGSLLEQALAPDQYASNVPTREGSEERVEFAVRLPGAQGRASVWLPIDAKFPLEYYQRLVEAADRADAAGVELAARELEARIRACARAIGEKYLEVPQTTDFGILFLPVEGLYAEVLRRPGLVELLQREHRVLVAGPTTLWAILSSLRLGFRTLAIQQRSSEVWALLGAVKTDFARFGATLDTVQKKLGEASSKIDEARRGSRRIERRLHDVQEPSSPAGPRELPAPVPLFEDVPAETEP
jgi:DNA recombination protein RmuC